MSTARHKVWALVQRGVPVAGVGVVAGASVALFHWSLHGLNDLLDWLIGVHQLVSLQQATRLLGSRLVLVPVMIFVALAISKVVATKSGVAKRRERGADRVIEVVNGAEVVLPIGEALGTAIAGVIALGLGVSGGPEGPIAMLVGGPIVNLAKRFGVGEREIRILVAVGVGAALATLFRAPLAGILLAGELFVLDGFVGAVIVPGLFVVAITWFVDSLLVGSAPLIGDLYLGNFHLEAYVSAIGIGVLAGLLGLLYRWWVAEVSPKLTGFSRLSLLRWLGVAIAVSVLTTGVALVAPEVLSTGTNWIRLVALFGHDSSVWPLWILLLVPLGRIILTGSSLSAEAPVGVLGPALIIGAFGGAALWRLAALAHLSITFGTAELFVILMFAAVFGSIGRIPLSMIVIAIEATGSVAIAPLVIVAVGVAVFLVRQRGMTIFGSQALPGKGPLSPLV